MVKKGGGRAVARASARHYNGLRAFLGVGGNVQGWSGGATCYGDGLQGADQFEGVAAVEEGEKALEVFVVEGVVDIFFEVEAEFIFRETHFLRGIGGDLRDLG